MEHAYPEVKSIDGDDVDGCVEVGYPTDFGVSPWWYLDGYSVCGEIAVKFLNRDIEFVHQPIPSVGVLGLEERGTDGEAVVDAEVFYERRSYTGIIDIQPVHLAALRKRHRAGPQKDSGATPDNQEAYKQCYNPTSVHTDLKGLKG